jgi:hypothetical protein
MRCREKEWGKISIDLAALPDCSPLHCTDKSCGVNDLNGVKMLQRKEVAVAGDDIICLCLQGTAEKFIVVGIFNDSISLVSILSHDRCFFTDQLQNPDPFFRFKSKLFLNIHLLQRFSGKDGGQISILDTDQ